MREGSTARKTVKSSSCPGHGKSCSENASSANVKKDNPASPHSFFNQFLQYEKSDFSSKKDGEKDSYKKHNIWVSQKGEYRMRVFKACLKKNKK
jgi:hypothetical protein